MYDEPLDPFAGDPSDPVFALDDEHRDGPERVDPLSPEERQDVLDDLADLDVYQTLLAPRGIRGLVVDCEDCRVPHYFAWDLLRANLRHLLHAGRTRVHEPAFNPDPNEYVTWEYARGYADGVQETLAETTHFDEDDELLDPFISGLNDSIFALHDEHGDGPERVDLLSPEERQDVLDDLADLDVYQTLLAPRGIRGLVVDCEDCRVPHYFAWDLLRANLRHLLHAGRTRVHEPAFNPDPNEYVTWEYARGYADGVQETLAETTHFDD